MKSLYFLSLLLVVAFAQEEPTDTDTGPDEPLIRCKRPLCEMACENGMQTDSNGCPICDCLQNPCETTMCEEGMRCEPQPCEEGQHPCIHMQPKCIPACPMVDCYMLCPFGRIKNEFGCDTCTCKTNPCEGFTCTTGQHCVPGRNTECEMDEDCDMEPMCISGDIETLPHSCNLMKCRNLCSYGNKKDDIGCPTCECKLDPCEGTECSVGEECRGVEVECIKAPCPLAPQCSYKPWCMHMHDMMDQAANGNPFMLGGAPMGGPMPGGPMGGPRDGPRGGHMGGWHHGDEEMGERRHHGMFGDAHHRIARAVRVARQLMERPAKLECDKDGGFKPLQCRKDVENLRCWCVDDRGFEIAGSGKDLTAESDIPVCAKNTTKQVRGSFKVSHDLDNIDEHMDNIQDMMKSNLGDWMQISHAYIISFSVSKCHREENILTVYFTATTDEMGNVDLVTSVNHLQLKMNSRQLSMEYEGHHLEAKPGSGKFEHQFDYDNPELPDHPLQYHPHHRHHFASAHRAVLIAGAAGLILLLGVLFCLCRMVARKRQASFKHRKMETFKDNLAFNNELYGQSFDEKKERLDEPELVVPSGDENEKNEAIA